MYDPVFTYNDKAMFRVKKIGNVLDRREADALCGPNAKKTRVPTFWYMPHCEAALYDNVLRANSGDMDDGDMHAADSAGDSAGDVSQKTKIEKTERTLHAFLGNKFETYDLRWIGRHSSPECPTYVLEAATAIAEKGVEIEVDPKGSFAAAASLGAFNDTSVQVWDGSRKTS
jgi:hypothetical protein